MIVLVKVFATWFFYRLFVLGEWFSELAGNRFYGVFWEFEVGMLEINLLLSVALKKFNCYLL